MSIKDRIIDSWVAECACESHSIMALSDSRVMYSVYAARVL